ncbi:MAG: hypothetical protein GVY12_11465 [Bacteroidetes bacterium]|jgi:sugar lactone lactonase YvrE|nr:hypothetical protein [Bacteroidota bacterium]
MPHTTPAIFLALLLGLMACQSLGSSEAEAEEDVLLSEAVMDLRIGEAEGAAPYRFEHISSVAADVDGRIVVADRDVGVVRAFDETGRYLFTVTAPGDDKVRRPCCLTFGPSGRLWFRNWHHSQYHAYTLTTDRAMPGESVSFGHSWQSFDNPLTFDNEGHLIHVGETLPHGTNSHIARQHRSVDEETKHTLVHPGARKGRIPVLEVPLDQFDAVFFSPMGPTQRHAHAPGGTWALTITDTYAVAWLDAAGDTLHVLQRDLKGPRLSDKEREDLRQQLDGWRENYSEHFSEFPFEVVDRKPPIETIFFDTDGRLWVQRSVEDGAPNEADVYTRDGTLAQVVQWPAGIDLSSGHLTADTLYGIRQGSDTFPQVVRLRY